MAPFTVTQEDRRLIHSVLDQPDGPDAEGEFKWPDRLEPLRVKALEALGDPDQDTLAALEAGDEPPLLKGDYAVDMPSAELELVLKVVQKLCGGVGGDDVKAAMGDYEPSADNLPADLQAAGLRAEVSPWRRVEAILHRLTTYQKQEEA